MTQKSSRFQRTAYARQAANLAEELNDWRAIYVGWAQKYDGATWTQREADKYAQRAVDLSHLVGQLRRIAMELKAMT